MIIREWCQLEFYGVKVYVASNGVGDLTSGICVEKNKHFVFVTKLYYVCPLNY